MRLQSTLSSETAAVEQRFEATTAVDLMQNGRVIVPAGSVVRGVVSGVKKAGRIERAGSLTLSFDQMVVNGRQMAIRGTATSVFESGGIREETGTAGITVTLANGWSEGSAPSRCATRYCTWSGKFSASG